MSRIRVSPNRRFGLWCFALASVGYFLIISSVQAGTLVGINPSPPPGPYLGDDNNADKVTVGSSNNPIAITLDPSGSPWNKQFTINRDGQGWAPGNTVSVMEWLTFPPTSTLRPTDWHETIDPSTGDGGNFQWGTGGSILIGTSTYPATLSGDGKSIWFDFPPISLSSPPVVINKTLVWTGGVITPGPNGTNNYVINISEQPSVPEPSSLIMASLTIAGLAMLTRCRPK